MAIIIGPDNLPHCTVCQDADLCPRHSEQVVKALGGLWTAMAMVTAKGDLAPLLGSRRLQRREDRTP